MFRPTISAIIRRFYDKIKGKMRKRTILYITVQSDTLRWFKYFIIPFLL